MPKRPKGRLFVAATLLAIGGVALFAVWDSLLRFSAHGVIRGKTVDVAAPWAGVLRSLHIRDGDEIRQGDLLATVVNLELEQRAAQIADELRIAQADLEAELVKLKFETLSREGVGQQAESDYYAMWGELLQEQSNLAGFVARRARADELKSQQAISEVEFDEIRFGEAGLRKKIEKMKLAVDEWKQRVDRTKAVAQETPGQLQPYLTRIKVLQDRLIRTREQLKLGEIRSPVNGRVIQTFRFSGEYADASQPIAQLLIEGSVEAVVYVPQESADAYCTGDTIEVIVPPATTRVHGTIARIGDQLEAAPLHLKRYFRADARLLPIFVKLDVDAQQSKLKLGGEVKLPLHFLGFKKSASRDESPASHSSKSPS